MITVETLQKAKEEYKSMADYYNGISFPILAGKFQAMSDLCSEMIEVCVAYDKLKPSVNDIPSSDEEVVSDEQQS